MQDGIRLAEYQYDWLEKDLKVLVASLKCVMHDCGACRLLNLGKTSRGLSPLDIDRCIALLMMVMIVIVERAL